MKDELFDDLLKRKLDREDPVVTSSEVDKVHGYVRQKLSTNQTGTWISKNWFKFFALSAIIVLGIWSVYQLKLIEENQKQLAKTNQILLSQNQILQVELLKRLKNLETPVNSSQGIKQEVNIPQKNKNVSPLDQRFAILQKKKVERFVEIAKNEVELSKEKYSENIIELASEEPLKVPGDGSKIGGDVETVKNDKERKLIDSLGDIQKEVVQQKKLLARMTSDSLMQLDSLLEEKQRRNWFKKIEYSAGLTSNIGIFERGLGIAGQAILSNRIQFKVGLVLNRIGGKEFEDEEEFRAERNKDFREEYTNRYSLGVMSECRDIKFQYSILQIPISVSYLMPLRKNYGLMFGLGSQLNLRATEIVRFQGLLQPSNTSMGHELNEVVKPMPLIHNMGVQVGLQKTWKRVSIQSLMYVNQSIQKTEFLPNLTSLGFNLNIFYRFGQ